MFIIVNWISVSAWRPLRGGSPFPSRGTCASGFTDRSASLASGCRHRCSTRKPECKPNQTKSRSKAPENSEIPRGEPKWTHMCHMCHMVRLQESVASATSPEHLLIWCIYGTYAMPSPSAAYPAQDQCSFSLSPPTIISY